MLPLSVALLTGRVRSLFRVMARVPGQFTVAERIRARSGMGLGGVRFFFSSRRRHTRSKRDWSSDVCSSDLQDRNGCKRGKLAPPYRLRDLKSRGHDFGIEHAAGSASLRQLNPGTLHITLARYRSEERRVGEECRSPWSSAQSVQRTRL